MQTSAELAAMRRAIIISASGLGSTSPNPPVGCVILDAEGSTAGEGYHLYKGSAHAEVNALAAAGARAAGGTAVVTLEPCNHTGLTPACHQGLLDAGIARVLIAVLDPTSRGEGGAERLRRAGVEVETHVLEQEALVVLAPWLASLAWQRPVLHLLRQLDTSGHPAPPSTEAVAEADKQRLVHDLVISAKDVVEEGRPGCHGTSVFRLPTGPLPAAPEAAVIHLTATGARTVLLTGTSKLSDRLLGAGLVDRLTFLQPIPTPSRTAASDASLPLPEGYALSRITRVGEQLVITAERRS
ncbi:bifunctional diaminohydroxyphosphoribosylaminopyrimidine deaminase/5-amino-6-(5-phosphoribosylamino)uracil reductase RibD [Streptomyces mobaraensis]|uniref:Riboflavin biosynthesis protein RibD n=1 Tax=Streptomyces mobaraensis TaxID=35621 RepID=A0A5N5W2J7_STRMB|nr:bifunctional diaminohydroxyphosphoribosylaminopyrimidine deaminase/5-amino-6-(5-phosphoribosylamino)uracil reductase RibD [Streptomyces mobaraensis]KAB7835495.1 riboflavin biosynthesis protein RibD [Streptomyces mobaraensis]